MPRIIVELIDPYIISIFSLVESLEQLRLKLDGGWKWESNSVSRSNEVINNIFG